MSYMQKVKLLLSCKLISKSAALLCDLVYIFSNVGFLITQLNLLMTGSSNVFMQSGSIPYKQEKALYDHIQPLSLEFAF